MKIFTLSNNVKHFLLAFSHGLFTLSAFISYYFMNPQHVHLGEVMITFIDLLGTLTISLFHYNDTWIFGRALSNIFTLIAIAIFWDVLLLYVKK